MPRAVDHLVIAAYDLPEQEALYRRLGFQVGARNRHPWGTENHIVQFDSDAFQPRAGCRPPGLGDRPLVAGGFPMPRALDHLVIAAHDLEAQAALYRRFGFQVGARNRHPWGTENHIVQFDGAFLELIGLGDGFAAPAASEAVFPFAGFLSAFLARREGLAMMVMRSADAEADRRGFEAAGIGGFARFDFARKGRRPDGARSKSPSRSPSPPARRCPRRVFSSASSISPRTSGAAPPRSIPTARSASPG